MKIVIIGAGIGGLGVYLFLQKHLCKFQLSKLSLEVIEVVIYETYNAVKREAHAKNTAEDEALEGFVTDAVGGALGVGPNGMRVLRDLDEGLFQEVADQGYPVSHFHIQNAYGWSLANFPATDKANPPLQTILISRQALWHSLRERIPDHAIIRKTVSGVTCGNHRPRISFTNGSPEAEADLIIGADGVRSVAKKAILGGSSEKVDYAAIYELVLNEDIGQKKFLMITLEVW